MEDELFTSWYGGRNPIGGIEIETERLAVIHANAFNEPAFKRLKYLALRVHFGPLKIHDDALQGLDIFLSLEMRVKGLKKLPTALFVPIAMSIRLIKFENWPNKVNLNEMFDTDIYRQLRTLQIRNVQLPQTRFRTLDATNFTSFRRLQHLELFNCGIEVIAERTFDIVGVTLLTIILDRNWIQFIDGAMFRIFYETKQPYLLSIERNRVEIECTCRLIELDVMQCPFRRIDRLCIDCVVTDSFVAAACGLYRILDYTKFHIDFNRTFIKRIINVHMTHQQGSILIKTNFTSRIRMLLIDFDAMSGGGGGGTCAHRTVPANFKCLHMNKSIERLELHGIDGIRDAKLISITVIPMLYDFSAHPLHSMTLRRTDTIVWIDVSTLGWTALVTCFLSSVVGFIGILGMIRLAKCIASGPIQHEYDVYSY